MVARNSIYLPAHMTLRVIGGAVAAQVSRDDDNSVGKVVSLGSDAVFGPYDLPYSFTVVGDADYAITSASAASADFTQTASFSAAAYPAVYNRNPANLRKLHRSIARVLAGEGRGLWMFVGDSKDAGAGAGTSNSGTQYYITGASPKSKPDKLASILNSRGIPASRMSWAGSKSLASTALISAYDSRLSFGSGWSGGQTTLGGVSLATGGTNPMTFTPGTVDSVDVITLRNTGAGTFALTDDISGGTALATIANSGSAAVLKTSVNLSSLGSRVISLTRTTGGFADVIAMIAKDSTTPAIDIVNAGAIGSQSSFHVTTASAWAAANTFAVMAPDAIFIQIGTNDLLAGVPTPTIMANITNIATAGQSAGADVILEIGTRGNGYGTSGEFDAYRRGVIALGASLGCVVIDHVARMGTFSEANALGFMKDAVHETAQGYAFEAQALMNAVVF